MRKVLVLLAIVLVFLGFSATVGAQETCKTATAYAVNPNRQLVAGEKVILVQGGIITTTQREKPGSSHIVLRRCVLPPKEVVMGGLLPWIKGCGQDFVPEGWAVPGMELREGPPGKPGTNAVNGTNGTNGVNGTNGTNGVNGTNGTNGEDGQDAHWWHCPKKCWGPIVAAIGVGIEETIRRRHNEVVTTKPPTPGLPVCTSLPCNK